MSYQSLLRSVMNKVALGECTAAEAKKLYAIRPVDAVNLEMFERTVALKKKQGARKVEKFKNEKQWKQ